MMKKQMVLGMVVVALAGCAEQAPAPVVNGYGTTPASTQPHYTLQAARTPGATYDVEPAAGPVQTSAPAMQEEQLASLPTAAAPKAVLPPPSVIGDAQRAPSSSKGWQQYTVQQGDTVYRLAREFNTSPDAILEANKMSSAADITKGQTLMIPAGIGRFGKLEAVAAVPSTLEKPVEQVAAVTLVEPAKPATTEVTGPSGARYKLTDTVASQAQAEPAVADVEPAAGPVESVTKPSGVSVLEHRVEPGETVYRIAQKYGASVIDIMGANDFAAPQDLKAGTVVKVPVANGKAPAVADGKMPKVIEEAEQVASLNTKTANDSAMTEVQAALHKGKVDPVASRTKGLVWPVKGSVLNGFGVQGQGVAHTGISIKVPANSPVMAAESGKVVYADKALRTYGNLVLIRHDNGMVTAYGHNNALLVVKGETVKKGQTIALSGNTGNVKDPQLHFEVRQNARAIDPLAVLPKR
jgi:murein DD-endopeptidase MepM/ murein hydrolase activator NlpD